MDYTKIVITSRSKYIDNHDAVIDKNEYNEIVINFVKIKECYWTLVGDYVARLKGTNIMHKREFKRRYKISSLKYFHRE